MSVQSNGVQIPYNDDRTVAFLAEDVKVLGQLIFAIGQPNPTVGSQNIALKYNLEGKQQQVIQISALAYSVTDDQSYYRDPIKRNEFLTDQIAGNMNPTPINGKGWTQVFDYQKEMQKYNISYIACRYPDMFPKFVRDPVFSVAYMNSAESSKLINNQIAILKVNGDLN
jgi:hypothetical protein